ncbi:VCBS repeat-containing protein [bacterium]|nr:VCBS repeat-containing protein [bacterium]
MWPRLGLETLEQRDTPAFLTGAEIAVGADAGGPPLVQLLDPGTGAVRTQFLAFDPSFYGGVRVAVGDVTGDGYPDLVTAAGRSGGPAVRVYDGLSGAVVASFFAFESGFAGGMYVAVGDVTGDGVGDIIAGAGAGGGPPVNVFDGYGSLLTSFFAYTPAFPGGVRVAAGDLGGVEGTAIVTAPGPGGGPDVRTYRVLPGSATPTLVGGFFAYDAAFAGGVYVAVGDVTGDGGGDIVTGAGAGAGPAVGVFGPDGQRLASFFAYDPSFRGGVRVATADLTGDGVAELITGPGSGGLLANVYSLPATTPLASVAGLPAGQSVGFSVAGSLKPLNVPTAPPDVISAAYAQYQATQQAVQAASAAARSRQTFFAPPPFSPVLLDPYGVFGPSGIGDAGFEDGFGVELDAV